MGHRYRKGSHEIVESQQCYLVTWLDKVRLTPRKGGNMRVQGSRNLYPQMVSVMASPYLTMRLGGGLNRQPLSGNYSSSNGFWDCITSWRLLGLLVEEGLRVWSLTRHSTIPKPTHLRM